VKTFGDGFLASFVSTQMALRCAIALERAFDQMPEVHGERLKVRVGINAGEPIAEGDDLYGHSVTVASQLAKAANGGEILVSLVVRELVAGKGFQFERRGTEQIGDEELPMEIYRVEWREAVPG
jgi:class 3 adenylate cyclase